MNEKGVKLGKPTKKQLEFSQKVVLLSTIFGFLIVVLALAGNFYLKANGMDGVMTEEVLSAVTTFSGIVSSSSISAYCALNAIRSWSRNKYCASEMGQKG